MKVCVGVVGTRVGDKVLTPHVVFCFSFCTPFPTCFLDDTRLFVLFPIAHTHSFHTQGVKRGDGGGRETQKEKTGEQAAQQGTVLVCGNHTHMGKTRQDMGMGGHTRGRKTWDTQGEREGRRQGVALPKTLTTQKKRKRQKDNEHHKTIKSIA